MKKCAIGIHAAFPVPALLLTAFLLLGTGLPVQNTYSLSKGYSVTISGTSNLRDWLETVGDVTGDIVANVNADGSVDLRAIRIKMDVRSIKSDMGRVMDNKTYDALKADAHPGILFTLDAPVRLSQVREGQTTVPVKGSLELAGVSRSVIMLVKTFEIGNGKLLFEGSQVLKMTDYGVKPPSALFGTMKAAPDITIRFKTNFTNQPILPIKQNGQ
jgi:polyisoprenoid-binding protein YceI